MASDMPIKDSAYGALALYWKILFIGKFERAVLDSYRSHSQMSARSSVISEEYDKILDFSEKKGVRFLEDKIDGSDTHDNIIYKISKTMPNSDNMTTITGYFDIDVTRKLENISNIDKSLDYPSITEFRVGEMSLTFNDDDRVFDPRYSDNIYKDLDSTKDNGYRIQVEVYTGFLEDSSDYQELTTNDHLLYIESRGLGDSFDKTPGELVFKGEIHKIDRNVNEKTVDITCIDMPQSMYDDSVTDFGLEKTFAVQGYYGSTGGEYPLPLDISPLSTESVSGFYFDDTDPDPDNRGNRFLTIEKALSTSGPLRRSQTTVNEDQINTALATSDNRTSDGQLIGHLPVINAKVPFRDKPIKSIIKQLLKKYNVEDDIELPDVELESPYFSSNGRVGYDIENKDEDKNFFTTDKNMNSDRPTDVSDFWRWRGFVTDFIAKSDGSKFIFLYSGRQTFYTKSKIIEYDVATDTYTELYKATEDVEYWSITSYNFNDFYVLGTRGSYTYNPLSSSYDTPFGLYDSAEPAGDIPDTSQDESTYKPNIWKFTRSGEILSSPENFVLHDDSNAPPQLAKYLHLGFGGDGPFRPTGNNRFGMLPFSNRLMINGSFLYYLWAKTQTLMGNTITEFGVARKHLTSGNSESVLTANRDTYQGKAGHNHGGCAFYIEGNMLYAAFSFINYSAQTSNFQVVSKSLT